MWSRRGIIAALLLAGCGFQPLHQQSSLPRGSIAFTAPETVVGYRLIERLEDRLGVSNAARYVLTTELTIKQETAVVTSGQDTERFRFVGGANWRLTESGTQVASGSVNGFTSFSASSTAVTTQAARRDAEARLAVLLADRIVTDLALSAP